jgi:hypothetical protein
MQYPGPIVKNENVIAAWQNGLTARNHRYTLSSVSYPNGRAELYSYDLKIGERTPAGAMVIADFTAGANGFHSMTTSCHVGLAKREVDSPVIMHPRVWKCSPMSDTDGNPNGKPF